MRLGLFCFPSCCSGVLCAGVRLGSIGAWGRPFQTCLQQQEPEPFLLFWKASAWIAVWCVLLGWVSVGSASPPCSLITFSCIFLHYLGILCLAWKGSANVTAM